MRPRSACILQLLVLLLALVGGSGCAAFRAQLGFGFGLGSMIKVPAIIHTGEMHEVYFWRVGHDYEKGWTAEGSGGEASFYFIHVDPEPGAWHRCWFIPVITDSGPKSWALEVDVNLIAIQLRLGFNAYYWFHPPRSRRTRPKGAAYIDVPERPPPDDSLQLFPPREKHW